MDISAYFKPLDQFKFASESEDSKSSRMYGIIEKYVEEDKFPDWTEANIAIIGVPEQRGAVNNKGCGKAPDFVRAKLYELRQAKYPYKIVDLGNLINGHSLNDTYSALAGIMAELLKSNVIPLIIGGSQDLTFAQYNAYQQLEQTVNITCVDAFFDLGTTEEKIHSHSYVGKIILQEPNFLFNFSNLGYQTYFVGHNQVDLMEKLYFDAYRLGQVRKDMEEVEPIIRNADIVSFDITSVRFSDAPGNGKASPNGFYGEEACQIARYAGISDKLSSIGFYEINPDLDKHGQTVHLVAQMIWYFIEGFYNRKKDLPLVNKSAFTKYRVAIKNSEHEIVFFKSKKSERWWMEVPYPSNKAKYERHHLVPCSYKDYETAVNQELPERWWQALQKLS